MEKTRLSFSAITTYTTCGQKYFYRYKKGLRSKYFHAALAFGSAIDLSLNELLLTKDLEKAKAVFNKSWNFQYVNKKYVALQEYTDLVYAATDYDVELLIEEDLQNLEQKRDWKNIQHEELYNKIKEDKESKGWAKLEEYKQKYYNYSNWLSVRRKGYIMLDSYNKQIMPRIKEVLAVQKENTLENSEGDKVVQYLDLIVKWEDGRNILFDNKTSAREYETDQASRSPQLISYYYGAKEQYKLDAVGFLVLKKAIYKNKIKICSTCGHDGTGGRHKTCDYTVKDVRCNGEWKVAISPECGIQVIINTVSETAENLVLDTFDDASHNIKQENYSKNLNACKNGPIICEFYGLCWKDDKSELIDVSNTNL